ncbi:MAG: hypothetical protein JXB14_06745 [Candidatus Altiarchaeota archaeon]|nr:hypothetical protein [Candidatus Altiarchaeota archaeon]
MSRVILALGVYAAIGILMSVLYALSNATDQRSRVVIWMGVTLVFLWVIVCGALIYRWRDLVKRASIANPIDWRVKFVVLAVFLALVEGAIATGMTNMAPFFGVRMGEAAITASANYLEVVLFHSVIVFIPMFLAWVWLLSKYDFSPNAVFVLFGITGNFAELGYGLQNLLAGFWILIYGLIIYLPAYSVPRERDVMKPNVLHYILAIFLPFLCALPVAAIVAAIRPG